MYRRPVAIDLYAGAGGLSLGMEQAGFDIAAAAEFDPIHALTHQFNFPETPVVCRDLNHGSADEVAELLLRTANTDVVDALVGGPPCQGFSAGGVREKDDARNGQLLRFVDLVIALRPRVFCLENVAGLLEPRFATLRQEALETLTRAGYRVGGHEYPVQASHFGVPQSRRRVLIMGSREGLPVPALQSGISEAVSVSEALAGLPNIAAYRRLLTVDEVPLSDADYQSLIATSTDYARRLIGLDKHSQDLARPRVHDMRLLTGSLRTVHTSKTAQRFARTEQGRVEPISRLFRLADDGVARTLRAGSGSDRGSHTSPRPIHPQKPRVITVREAARLHGFPDWFRFHATNWHGHRQIGNSVPPPLAAAAGRALMKALGVVGSAPSNSTPLELGDTAWLRQSQREAAATLLKIELNDLYHEFAS